MKSCLPLFVSVIFLLLLSCNHVSSPADSPELAENLFEKDCRIEIAYEYPIITVTNKYIDPVISSTPIPFPVIFEAPAGLPLEFCWTAEASDQGGKVEAYRYGWDIHDVDDPALWSIEFTPLKKHGACAPPQTFSFGTHTFHVEVIDESSNNSRAMIKLNIAPYPMFFDLMPGSCPNSLNPKKNGIIPAAIPSSPGFDLNTIDSSTLELWIDGNIVYPVKTFFEDVTSPAIFQGDCDCYEGRRDGVDDLVLKFSAQEVIDALGAVTCGDVKIISLRGFGQMGLHLDMRDCITIVGNPHAYGSDRGGGIDISK
jgi:hypothetical protein